MHNLVPLQFLAAGAGAHISHLAGAPDAIHRLSELGFREGARVQMIQPGSPCIVLIDGQKLCFRTDELMQVLVRPQILTGATA